MDLFPDTHVLGFTGTRKGMSESQRRWFEEFVAMNHLLSFHHGDCVGADSDAHAIVRACAPTTPIIIHPCNLPSQRAFCLGSSKVHEPQDPLKRNRIIVDQSTRMVAMPSSRQEEIRSGTWATIRYARKIHRDLVIIYPE